MRHRIKKIPTLSKFTSHHLLHSDKSTYFYEGKVKTILYSYSIPLLSSLALLLVCGIMLSPSINLDEPTDTAYATESENGEEVTSGYKPRTSTSMTLTLDFNNTVQAKKEVAANTPGFTAVGMKITATGIDENGYALYVQAADGNTNSLVNSIDASKTINPVPGDTLGSELKANTWGYSVVAGEANSKTEDDLKSLTYSPVSPSGDISSPALYSKDELTASPYTLAFGANIGSTNAIGETMPVGSYKTNVLVSLAASADGVATLDSFIGFTDPDTGEKKIYMQDLDKATCDKLTIGDEWQLRDKRDNKIYWVAKLNDNNCWMTQNLNLNLAQNQTLTSELSDVDNWTPEENETTLIPGELNNTTWPHANYNVIRSYNPGVNLLKDGKNSEPIAHPEILTQEFLTLEEVGLDSTWTITHDKSFITVSEYDALNNKKICTKIKGSMLGNNDYIPCRIVYVQYLTGGNYYNTHYLQGNYYSWGAATAGQASSLTNTTEGQKATQSICPKNWQLPASGNNSINPPSFGNLLNSVNATAIAKSPYYFTYSGVANRGSLPDTGNGGYYWSTTASNSTSAYTLFISSSEIRPSSTNNRHNGQSIRCVTK